MGPGLRPTIPDFQGISLGLHQPAASLHIISKPYPAMKEFVVVFAEMYSRLVQVADLFGYFGVRMTNNLLAAVDFVMEKRSSHKGINPPTAQFRAHRGHKPTSGFANGNGSHGK